MNKTTENIVGITAIIEMLRQNNPQTTIGEYVEHYVSERRTYIVLLDNRTTIEINRSVAQDAENAPYSIDEESLERIINTYKTI